jgi:two-component system cell cycle sensor histidine kinase/response regulator CckA
MIQIDHAALPRSELYSAKLLLIGFGFACLTLGFFAPYATLSAGFFAAGLAFLVTALATWARHWLKARSDAQAFSQLALLVEHDVAACVLTDHDGIVLKSNRVAQKLLKSGSGHSLRDLLSRFVADASSLLHRVQSAALEDGIASEKVVLPDSHLQISAHQVGAQALLWRFEYFEEKEGSTPAARFPKLTLGRGGTVLWMNQAARALAGGRVRNIGDLIEDTPLRPGEVHNLTSGASQKEYVVNIHEAGLGREEVVLIPSLNRSEDAVDDTGFDGLPVPLLKLLPNGTIRRANRSARELLNAPQAEDRMLADFMEGLGRSISDWLEDAAAGQGLRRSEFLRLIRSDRDVFVQVTLTRVVEHGQAMLVAVLNDATELKSLEAQFVQGQKMQAIGQLAGGVAHDFNNLLTAISGHCDLLLLRHDQGDPEYGDLIQIHQNANRAAGLVGQLLAFSRKQTLRPESLDLRDILSDLTHLLNRLVGEKVKLELRQNPVLPNIRADKRQLEQVIMNLVVNARDAMAKGGRILIETEEQVLDAPAQHGRAKVPAGAYATVRVTDEGMGIPNDKLEKIFEPFFTTKRTGEGTGLGLSTVYGIVKQTGGFIFVDSVVGKGSVFTLMFPVCDAPVSVAPQPEVTPAIATASFGDGVVLLVEDEAPVRAFASRALSHRGFQVIEADCAETALELLEDEDLHIDVFVTDVVMPGLDGPSWVREAREARPDVPVVFMSGYAEDVFKSQGARIDASAFISKPFSLTDLTAIVNQQLVHPKNVPDAKPPE